MNEVTGEINAVIDPVTGNKKEYRYLMIDPATQVIWEPAMTAEVHIYLARKQYKLIRKSDVRRGRKIVYLRIVVNIREDKVATERVRTTVGGDQVNYPGEVTTCTVELNTVDIHLNSELSTSNTKYTTMDLEDFYVNKPMARTEYARLKVEFTR